MPRVVVEIKYLDYSLEYGLCEAVIRIPVVSKDPIRAASRIARVRHGIMPFDISGIMVCIPEKSDKLDELDEDNLRLDFTEDDDLPF